MVLRDDQFEKRFLPYYRDIFNFIRKRIHSVQVCEDLTQDTFLAAYRKRDAYTEDRNPKGWLLAIARYLVLNYVNREKHSQSLDEDQLEETPTEDPLTALVHNQEEERVRSFLQSLPPQQRHCLSLYSQHYKYREIAKKMKLKTNTVKSHIFKARASAKKLLGDQTNGQPN